MVLRMCGVVFGLLLAAQAAADTLDMNLHEDALRLTYARGVGPSTRGLNLDVGYLYAKNPGETDQLAHAGLQVIGQNWSKSGNFDIGMGGRLVFGDTKPGSVGGIGFGGHVRFSPVQRIGVGAELYYAPKITSFLDAEEYREWSMYADYQVVAPGFVYIGYRNVEADIKNKGTVRIDDNLHVGMRLLF